MGKEYWPLEKIDILFAHISHHEDAQGHRFIYENAKRFNENDGIIFTPDERPLRPGKRLEVKKWKWPQCTSVLFLIRLGTEMRVDGKPPRPVFKAHLAVGSRTRCANP